MFYRSKVKKKDILKIFDDSFVSVNKVHENGDVDFKFTYFVDQKKIVHFSLTTARVTIRRQRANITQVFNVATGTPSSKDLIDSVKKIVRNTKNDEKNARTFVVATKDSDLTSRVSKNTLRSDLEETATSRLVTVNVDSLNRENKIEPLLSFTGHVNATDEIRNISSSIKFDAQDLMYRLVVEQRIDPSVVANLSQRTVKAKNSFEGTLRQVQTREAETDVINKLFHVHVPATRQTSSSELNSPAKHVSVVRQLNDDFVRVETTLTVKKKILSSNGYRLTVDVDILDVKSRAIVQSYVRDLNVDMMLRFHIAPRVPPKVNVSFTDLASKAVLQLTPGDDKTRSFSVFKKVVNMNSVDNDTYNLLKTIQLQGKETASLTVDRNETSTSIYRIIPVGLNLMMSTEYTNVVIGPFRVNNDRSLSIVTRSHPLGVEVEVGSFPPEVVSIQILTRNLSTFEKVQRIVNNKMTLVDDSLRTTGTFMLIDDLASEHNVHEYVAKMLYRNGTQSYSISSIIERIPSQENKVQITVKDLLITNDANRPSVSFTIETNLLNGTIDTIYKLLAENGAKELFINELKAERTSLQQLVVHNVNRINLTTGTRINMGVVNDGKFIDSNAENESIPSLVYGHKYQYEVVPYLRDVESMLANFSKSLVDPLTKKKYFTSPQKFNNPYTLRTGTLLNGSTVSILSKDQFALGEVGTRELVNVSFDKKLLTVDNVSASRFSEQVNLVSWKINSNDLDAIDHCLVIEELDGVRTIVGKVHSYATMGNFSFYHEFTGNSRGEINYIIVVIFNDYTISDEFVSNSVIV